MDCWGPTHSSTESRTDSLDQVLDSADALFTALVHYVGRAEFPRELLSRGVTTHCNEPLGTQFLGRKHTPQADSAITDDCDGLARLHVGRPSGEPTRAHDIGNRKKARDQLFRGNLWRGHQRSVRKRDTQHRRLRRANELSVLARGLVAQLAVRTDVIGGKERSDDDLPGLDPGDGAAELLDDAAVFVSHRGRLRDRTDSAVESQVGAAHTGGRNLYDCIRWLEKFPGVALIETHISRTVEYGSFPGISPLNVNLLFCCGGRHERAGRACLK